MVAHPPTAPDPHPCTVAQHARDLADAVELRGWIDDAVEILDELEGDAVAAEDVLLQAAGGRITPKEVRVLVAIASAD